MACAQVIRLSQHPLAIRAGFRHRARHAALALRLFEPVTAAPSTIDRVFAALVIVSGAATLAGFLALPAMQLFGG